ncbi:MAG: hypothetical protein MZU97_17730 [Bacillus subtilis]|nr:hypothetical protein [Bacillus subtilis]
MPFAVLFEEFAPMLNDLEACESAADDGFCTLESNKSIIQVGFFRTQSTLFVEWYRVDVSGYAIFKRNPIEWYLIAYEPTAAGVRFRLSVEYGPIGGDESSRIRGYATIEETGDVILASYVPMVPEMASYSHYNHGTTNIVLLGILLIMWNTDWSTTLCRFNTNWLSTPKEIRCGDR